MYVLKAFRRHRVVPLATFIGIHEKGSIVDIKGTSKRNTPSMLAWLSKENLQCYPACCGTAVSKQVKSAPACTLSASVTP